MCGRVWVYAGVESLSWHRGRSARSSATCAATHRMLYHPADNAVGLLALSVMLCCKQFIEQARDEETAPLDSAGLHARQARSHLPVRLQSAVHDRGTAACRAS